MVLKDLNGPTWDMAVPNRDPVWHTTNIAWLALAIWIMCSHLATTVFILGKDRLRHQPKNLLIINVSLTNLLLGAFIVPALIHVNVSWIQFTSEVSCTLRLVLMAFNHHLQPTVALFSVLTLGIERLVNVLLLSRRRKQSKLFKIVMTIVYFLAPWLLTIIIILPLFFAGIGEKRPDRDCLYEIIPSNFIVAHVLGYILPAIGIIIVTKWIGLFDCVKMRGEMSTSLSALRRESLIVVAIVGTVSILFELPFFVVRLLLLSNDCDEPYCVKFFEALETALWLRIIKAAIFPFLWLAYWDARAAIMNLPDCTKDMDTDTESTAEMSFSDYPTLERRPLRQVNL